MFLILFIQAIRGLLTSYGKYQGKKNTEQESFLLTKAFNSKEEGTKNKKNRQTAREVCLELNNSRKTTGLLPSLLLFLCGIEILFEGAVYAENFHTEVVALVSRYYPL